MKAYLSSPVSSFFLSEFRIKQRARLLGVLAVFHRGITGYRFLRLRFGGFLRLGSIRATLDLAERLSFPVSSPRRVKRRWALRARNPPRDNPADGAPMAPVLPGCLLGLGAFGLLPSDTRAMPPKTHRHAGENVVRCSAPALCPTPPTIL
jgi:hypothetical protein